MMQANFESSSFNVTCPIFTIHGNHDEPTGSDHGHRSDPLSICQTLATNGLLNFFGKCDSSTKIRVKPIILKKEDIVLAIYGIGFIPDQRLKKLWLDKQVVFESPPMDSFRILVLHQNRACHDESKHLPDNLAPDFFNLIIRGHEHDALEPETHSEIAIVYQPGSTVATSITRGEAIPKKVAVMKIYKESCGDNPFKLVPELKTLESCRSMFVKDLTERDVKRYIELKKDDLTTLTPPKIAELSRDYAIETVRAVLEEFNSQSISTDGKFTRPSLPLIRIRIEYTDKTHRFNPLDVSREFYPNQVANSDIVLFMKSKFVIQNEKQVNVTFDFDSYDSDNDEMDLDDLDTMDIKQMKKISIDSIINSYFDDKPENEQLKLVKTKTFTQVIKDLGDRGDVVGKEMEKIKNLFMHKFESSIGSEEDAELYLNEEVQVKSRLLSLLEDRVKMEEDLYSGDFVDLI